MFLMVKYINAQISTLWQSFVLYDRQFLLICSITVLRRLIVHIANLESILDTHRLKGMLSK